MTPSDWDDMCSVGGWHRDAGAQHVRQLVMDPSRDERYLVYNLYRLVPCDSPSLPVSPDVARLRELAAQHPDGIPGRGGPRTSPSRPSPRVVRICRDTSAHADGAHDRSVQRRPGQDLRRRPPPARDGQPANVARVITTFLVEYPWLTTVALLVAVTLGPLLGYWLIERPVLALWLGVLSLLPVVALTLVPTGRDLAVGCAAEWSFADAGGGGADGQSRPLRAAGPPVRCRSPPTAARARRRSATSALIEVLQAYATVLGRSCSTNDWLYNTLGAALGAAIAVAALGARERPEPAPQPARGRQPDLPGGIRTRF